MFGGTSVLLGQAVVAAELLTLTGSTDTLTDICHVH